MQTSELRERLASAFRAESEDSPLRTGFGLRRAAIEVDWASAYLLADVALGVFKDTATIANLSHKKVVGDAPVFDRELVLVTCSCGGIDGMFVRPDFVDEVFANHLAQVRDCMPSSVSVKTPEPAT